jgi:hypothetical protein
MLVQHKENYVVKPKAAACEHGLPGRFFEHIVIIQSATGFCQACR